MMLEECQERFPHHHHLVEDALPEVDWSGPCISGHDATGELSGGCGCPWNVEYCLSWLRARYAKEGLGYDF